jgi:hypothetical protein
MRDVERQRRGSQRHQRIPDRTVDAVRNAQASGSDGLGALRYG